MSSVCRRDIVWQLLARGSWMEGWRDGEVGRRFVPGSGAGDPPRRSAVRGGQLPFLPFQLEHVHPHVDEWETAAIQDPFSKVWDDVWGGIIDIKSTTIANTRSLSVKIIFNYFYSMFFLVAQDETYTVRWKDEREAGLLHLVLYTGEWPWVEFIIFTW